MKRALITFACLFAAHMASGCAMLTSSLDVLQGGEGAYYFLPIAKVPITVTRENDICSVEIKEPVYEPDTTLLYSLKYSASGLSDDQVKVTLTPNGLLEKIEVTAEDKTSEIVGKAVEVAKAAVKAAAIYAFEVSKPPTLILDISIDPTDPKTFEDLNNTLGEECKLKIEPPRRREISALPSDGRGLFFRALRPYPIIVKDIGNRALPKVIVRKTVLVPSGPIMSLNVNRGAFIRKVSTITFDNGVLRSVSYQKPSEVLGFAEIPLKITQALVSVPTDLVQFKIDYTNKNKDLLDAQKGQLDALKQLLDAQEALRKTQAELEKERAANQ